MDYGNLREEDLEFGLPLQDKDSGEYHPRISNMGKIQRTKITGFDRREPTACATPPSTVPIRMANPARSSSSAGICTSARVASASNRCALPSASPYDRDVRAVAPHGAYSLLPMMATVDSKASAQAWLDVGFGGQAVGVKAGYELSQSGEATKSIVINGIPCVYYCAEDPGDPDRCNAVKWNLFENEVQTSGLPTFFRTCGTA
ncbi:hypothetical protein V8E54_012343 [Elaphomyces granulatus]